MRNFTCWGPGAGFQLSGKRVIIGTINQKKMDCAPLRPNKTRLRLAQDRDGWKKFVSALCSTWSEED